MENKTLKIEIVPIDSVVPDPANARRHDEKNIIAIKGSLARFGQQKPIVITLDNVIRAGNGTWQAAKELGWTTINVVRSHLTGAEAIGFSIADNRSSELGAWEESILFAQLESIIDAEVDVSQLGWSEKDIAALNSGIENLPTEFKNVDENIKTDFKCPKCGYEWSGKENQDVHPST
jgi:ParB-like chromosome segregation protein Spo0J